MAVSITGEEKIGAPIEKVWAAINDPEVLRVCIPACERLEQKSPSEMAATLVFKLGPLRVTFLGTVRLSNIDAPRALTITGEGKGGIAGFAKGSADVTLDEAGSGATLLSYRANVDAGGRIAQLGNRLIESSVRRVAATFFTRLAARIRAEASRKGVS